MAVSKNSLKKVQPPMAAGRFVNRAYVLNFLGISFRQWMFACKDGVIPPPVKLKESFYGFRYGYELDKIIDLKRQMEDRMLRL